MTSEDHELTDLSVSECVAKVENGSLTCTELVQHFADTLAKTEDAVGAWQHYNAEGAIDRAHALDAQYKRGEPKGALHGIPIGLKDIFDTADFPTEFGSPIHQGRQPENDCAVVDKLKAAGAVIVGKTVTTEFAFMHPSRTCNPHNHAYSPGGSSSGSAAAVAAGHIPLALGTQTTGSVVRPASFCGVYGFKPSRGLISRRGALQTSATLDHVGIFTRHLEDMPLLTQTIAGYDSADSASYDQSVPDFVQTFQSESSEQPSIIWIDMPYKDNYSADATAEFESLISKLGDRITRVKAPTEFTQYLAAHKTIYFYEIVRCLKNEIDHHWEDISSTAQPYLKIGQAVSDVQYAEALVLRNQAKNWFAQFFTQHDTILTPSALGEAPLMGSTGDPICCALWTLCGLPCINLPLLRGANGLPIGVQLVGAYQQDHHLLRNARHLSEDLTKNKRGTDHV